MKIALLCAALALLSALPASADTPPHYKLTVLPLRLDTGGDLNNKGQIVGTVIAGHHETSDGSQPTHSAVLWQKGRPLRRLAIPIPPHLTDSYPVRINDRGAVVGRFYSQDSGAITLIESEAFRWQKGRTTKISGLPDNGYSEAFGLNNKGEVVETFNNNLRAVDVPPNADVSFPHSFVYRSGRMTSFGFGVANGINDSGEVIGEYAERVEDATQGVLWRGGHRTLLGMDPAAINKWGWIAGARDIYNPGDHRHLQPVSLACLWKKGRAFTLGKPGSVAAALNSRGQVVGEVTKPEPHSLPQEHAILWQRGREYDLNRCVRLPRGWTLSGATGINDQGWIIGTGGISDGPSSPPLGRQFTFLLTPR